MTGELKLAIFDVDGTIVDSQMHILSAMDAAFAKAGAKPPARSEVLGIVGLSLPDALMRLVPAASHRLRDDLAGHYREAWSRIAQADPHAASPLFDGAKLELERLTVRDDVLLGVATGKSRSGLSHIMELHDLHGHFVTRQVSDDHPSKPHPSMVSAALAEAGCEPGNAVMIGDTAFDMEMGRAAGVRTLAVSWGYHDVDRLAGARPDRMIHDMTQLAESVLELLDLSDE